MLQVTIGAMSESPESVAAFAHIRDQVRKFVRKDAAARCGSDHQKQPWMPRMASGEVVASFALTEPGAGSNPAGLWTRARRHTDGCVTSEIQRLIVGGGLVQQAARQ